MTALVAVVAIGLVMWGVADLISAATHLFRAVWVLLFELVPNIVLRLVGR